MLELKVPPPVYAVLIAGLMWLASLYFPIVEMINPSWNKLAFIFVGVGLMLDASAVIQFFLTHTTINPLSPKKTDKLVMSELYSLTRNPMYLGMLSLLLAWSIWLGSLSSIIFIPIFIKLINSQQIIPEEKILEHTFGQQYRDYMSSVRRWL